MVVVSEDTDGMDRNGRLQGNRVDATKTPTTSLCLRSQRPSQAQPWQTVDVVDDALILVGLCNMIEKGLLSEMKQYSSYIANSPPFAASSQINKPRFVGVTRMISRLVQCGGTDLPDSGARTVGLHRPHER